MIKSNEVSCEEIEPDPYCHCPNCSDFYDKIVNPLQAPKKGRGDVWLEVLNDWPEGGFKNVFRARRNMGIAKYGQPLQYEDGRDPVIDLFQELLDAVVYAKKGVLEGKIHDQDYQEIITFTEKFFNVYVSKVSPAK